jgi:hypothetical protein
MPADKQGRATPGSRQPAATYWRSFPRLEKLLQEEQPQLLARVQDTCRALDRILQSGSPQEKARAEEALTGYLRALELYRELVARRDQAVAEASNSVRAAHDK